MAANLTWPFVRLVATSGEISIRVGIGSLWNKTFTIPRENIAVIQKARGLFSTGIRINHTLAGYPPYILFWTFRYTELKRELAALGYQVDEA